jgi:hypothetical protein
MSETDITLILLVVRQSVDLLQSYLDLRLLVGLHRRHHQLELLPLNAVFQVKLRRLRAVVDIFISKGNHLMLMS